MKKWLSQGLVAGLAAILLTTTAWAAGGTFRDVPTSHWGYPYVERAAAQSWVSGMGDGTFAPDSALNGAAVCAMLTNILDLDYSAGAYWWSGPVNKAQQAGLLDNTALYDSYAQAGGRWTSSAVEKKLSRYDMAMMVYNAGQAGIEGVSLPELSEAQLTQAASRIGDYSSIPQRYQRAVATVFAAGIVSGKGADGSYCGNDSLTRAEACVFLGAIADKMGTPSGSGSQQPSQTQQPGQSTQMSEEELIAGVLELVNQERAKEGLSPLKTYTMLDEAADVRAGEIVSLFSHTRPDGTSCFTALDETGAKVSGTYTYGENIAAGSATPEGVMDQWMNSPGHRANILNKDYTHIGIGYRKASGSQYGYYWVQMFVGTTKDPGTSTSTGQTGNQTQSGNQSQAGNQTQSGNQSQTGNQTQTGTTQTSAMSPEELMAGVVELVNQERAKEGLSPLKTYTMLDEAADVRAGEIVSLFSHTRPDGRSCFTALDEAGAKVSGTYTYGENIAAGSATPEGVMNQWMNSPGHRANILNKDYTHIGVGYRKASGSQYGYYWVQMFVGTTKDPSSGSSGQGTSQTAQTGTSGSTTTNNTANTANTTTNTTKAGSTPSYAKGEVVLMDRYREDWRDGSYLEVSIVNGSTIRVESCYASQDAYIQRMVLKVAGRTSACQDEQVFQAGKPFVMEAQVDMDILRQVTEAGSYSYVTFMFDQNPYGSSTSSLGGTSFQYASVSLVGDGESCQLRVAYR